MRYSLQCMVIQLCIGGNHSASFQIFNHHQHHHPFLPAWSLSWWQYWSSFCHRDDDDYDDADDDAGKQQQSQQSFSEGELHPRLRRLLCHRLTFFIVIIMMVIIIMMVRLEQVFSFRTCPSSRHKGKASHQKSSLPTCPRFKNKTCPRV